MACKNTIDLDPDDYFVIFERRRDADGDHPGHARAREGVA